MQGHIRLLTCNPELPRYAAAELMTLVAVGHGPEQSATNPSSSNTSPRALKCPAVLFDQRAYGLSIIVNNVWHLPTASSASASVTVAFTSLE